jgi:carboxypeptidase C (cathepsin A)
MDQPVGVGLSYTDNEKGYANDQKLIADNLYKGISKFLEKYPKYRNLPLYLAGESYAGKYIPSLAQRILDSNENNLNFKG